MTHTPASRTRIVNPGANVCLEINDLDFGIDTSLIKSSSRTRVAGNRSIRVSAFAVAANASEIHWPCNTAFPCTALSGTAYRPSGNRR